MKIIVLIKQVPDSDEIKMDLEKGTMMRDGMESIINPLDLNALELALTIRKQYGGEIDVVSMGPLQAEFALREALALGADRACLVSDKFFAGADSWATALVLSRTIKRLGKADLIIAGGKATDGETGQVGPEIAAMLNMPCVTYVSSVRLDDNSIIARRTIEEGYEIQKVKYPCLLTVLNDINEPRMPTLNGKKSARRASLLCYGALDLGLCREETGLAGSPTRVVKVSHPKISRQTAFYSGRDLDKGIEQVITLLRDSAVL